jgi:hypothetical protein
VDMKSSIITLLALLCCGCLLDSVEPWLSPESVVATEVGVDGKWSVVDESTLFGSGSVDITIERRPATSGKGEFFYVKIRPERRNTQFVFRATVHDIDGLRFLQIDNFTHFDQEIFGLANRPTYSLWRVEADRDNIVMWMPMLSREIAETLDTRKDQDDNTLFVDSAANNEAMIREWVEAWHKTETRPDKALMLGLTRAGTGFRMPAAVERYLPELYRLEKDLEPNASEADDP